MRTHVSVLVGLALLGTTPLAAAATRTVGPGKTYAKPCDAIAAAQAGDVIEVDAAGDYAGDHCAWSTDDLTVRGVNGRAKIDAGKDPANIAAGKGIFVVYAPSATIENFELAGAKTATDGNGAGIRHQGTNLTVRGCFFHDDEDGILGGPSVDGTGEVLIENSEFAANGIGDGQSHNMYLNHYAKFTLRGSYSHGANVGHLLKSRALENHIVGNRLTDEAGTTASYEINLPNAGLSFVIGNVIEQSAATQNPAILDYASEPSGMNAEHRLFVVNNTFVNDKGSGTFVQNAASEAAVLVNNLFLGGGNVTNQANAVLTTNFTGAVVDAKLSDAGAFDYHLGAGSPAIDAGSDPGTGAGQSLLPVLEYVHPLGTVPRTSVGTIDLGAYELGNPGALADGGDPGSSGGTSSGGGSSSSGGPSGTNPAPTSSGGASAPSSDGGCGCRVHSARNEWMPLAGVGLAMLVVARRRRR